VVASTGAVVDPTTDTVVHQFPASGAVAVDQAAGEVWFAGGSQLRRFGLADRAARGTRAIPMASSRQLVDVGTGLVAASDQALVLAGPGVTGGGFATPPEPPPVLDPDATVVTPIEGHTVEPAGDGHHVLVGTDVTDEDPQSLVEVDPRTGERTRSVWVGGDPDHLAATDDGRTIVVGHASASRFTEVDGTSFTIRRTQQLGIIDESFVKVADVATLPGRNDRFVVSAGPQTPGRLSSTQLHVDGVPQPRNAPTASELIPLDDPSVVMSLTFPSGGTSYLTRYSVTDGVDQEAQVLTPALANGGQAAGDRVVTRRGDIIDTDLLLTTGALWQRSWVTPVPRRDRLVSFVPSQWTPSDVTEHGLRSLATYATRDLNAEGHAHDIRATDDGIVILAQEEHLTFVPYTTAAPQAPEALEVERGTAVTTLTWQPPTDDGGLDVTGYRVYRDGDQVATVTDPSYDDLLGGAGGAHRYAVSAVNADGEGTRSPEVVADPDRTAPTAAITTPIDGATLARGSTVVADYACADVGGSGLTRCDGGVADGRRVDTSVPGTHRFVVQALDAAGNATTATATYTVTNVPEVEPPTPPAPTCAGRAATVVLADGDRPTARTDVIVGTARRDVILALGGDDLVCGGGGPDRLDGGPGADVLRGGPGRDDCHGRRGRDQRFGCETATGFP
jgi:hypothetical protein